MTSKQIWLVLAVFLVVPKAFALSIDNRNEDPVLVIVKNEAFAELGKWKIPAETQADIPVEDSKPIKKKLQSRKVYHLEVYTYSKEDPTGAPTFFHDVKPSATVCVPYELCPESQKKKKKGPGFRLW